MVTIASRLDELTERLESLQAGNGRLRARLEAIEGSRPPAAQAPPARKAHATQARPSGMPLDTVSRRGLLRRTGTMVAAAAGAAVGSLGRPAPASAEAAYVELGADNHAVTGTTLNVTQSGGPGKYGFAVKKEDTFAFDVSGAISGYDEGTYRNGVFGQSDYQFGNGLYGFAPGSIGYGVFGTGGAVGVFGTSENIGIQGSSTGRGGVFAGNKAAVKLKPSTSASHPASGQRGDLVVDSTGRLWFCKSGSSWHQLA